MLSAVQKPCALKARTIHSNKSTISKIERFAKFVILFGIFAFRRLLIFHAHHEQFIGSNLGGVNLLDYPSFFHYQYAVADLEEFFEFGGDKDRADGFFAEVPHYLENLLFCLYVDSPGGLIEEYDLRLGAEPIADDDLLLISAAERRDIVFDVGDFDIELFYLFIDEAFFAGPGRKAFYGDAVEAGEGHIGTGA